MLMFQEPLWPKAKAASGWKATLPNQDDAKQPILVDCKAELDKDGTIVLTQKLTQTKELVSAGLKLESVLRINAKTGKVKSVHESIAVKSQGGPDMTILFDIQS